MRHILSVTTIAIVAAGALSAGQAPDAKKILADMQTALGGADKVAAVRTLTAKGVVRRTTPRGNVANAQELSIALPDKYLSRMVIAGEGPMAVFRNTGFNGDGLIFATDAPPNLAGAMGERLARSDRVGGGAGNAPTAEEAAATRARQLQVQKYDFARMTIGLFGASYAGFPVTFSYGGEAESGEGAAHIIDVSGAGGFAAKLFVDTKTSMPLMLAWSQPGAGANAGRDIEFQNFYADFKSVGGLLMPHTLRRSVDGKPTQETLFEEIVINPTIDAKVFEISK